MSGTRHKGAEILFLKDVALSGCRLKGSYMAIGCKQSGIGQCELSAAMIYLSLADLKELE